MRNILDMKSIVTVIAMMTLQCLFDPGMSQHMSDLAVLDCNAQLHLSPNAAMKTTVDLSALKHIANTVAAEAYDTAKSVCPNIEVIDFKRRFLPTVEAFLAGIASPPYRGNDNCFVDGMSKAGLFTDSFFSDATLLKLPCNYNDYVSGKPCAMKISIPSTDIHVGINVKQCPNSYLPFFSITCHGPMCQSLFIPCDTDADCSVGTKCEGTGMSDGDMMDFMSNMLIGMTLIDDAASHDMKQHMIRLKAYLTGLMKSPYGGAATDSAKVCIPDVASTEQAVSESEQELYGNHPSKLRVADIIHFEFV